MIELVDWLDELIVLVPEPLLTEQVAEAAFEMGQAKYIASETPEGVSLLSTFYYISDVRKYGDDYLFTWIPSKKAD